MKFSTKIRYGLRAIYEIAKNYESKTPVFQKQIAEMQGLSNKYLDQIIDRLKAANLIYSVNGKRNGYLLTKPPSEINVLEVHNAFSNGLYVIDCLSPNINCDLVKVCPTVDFWDGLNQTINSYFKSKTIQDLIDEAKNKGVV